MSILLQNVLAELLSGSATSAAVSALLEGFVRRAMQSVRHEDTVHSQRNLRQLLRSRKKQLQPEMNEIEAQIQSTTETLLRVTPSDVQDWLQAQSDLSKFMRDSVLSSFPVELNAVDEM